MIPTAAKTNRTVVRNQAYSASGFGIRERHNERKNESYHNGDIEQERIALNIHFRQHLRSDGIPETYEETFKRLLAEGTIVKRGLKEDAKVFDELIFDVNTEFFEQGGGYDFAKTFFEEAYRLAVQEVGGEQFILSAVMHADERNRALSEQLGRDVYHYHLHVVYVPVVEKEILWSKRCKDPALVGTVKEIIPQISHSKKWPGRMPVQRDGRTIMLNAYSLLQDRFFEHMREAGFVGFERGERGSTAEHLDVLDYKIKQEETRIAKLDEQLEKKQERLSALDRKLAAAKRESLTFSEIDGMVKRTLIGNLQLSAEDWKTVSDLAKKGVAADSKLADMQRQLASAQKSGDIWKERYQSLLEHVSLFLDAIKHAPNRVNELLAVVLRQPPEIPDSKQLPKRERQKKTREVR